MTEAFLNTSYQYRKRTLNQILLSQLQDSGDECLEIDNDCWMTISILKDSLQYLKIKIQDYFPIKIFLNVGPFKCKVFFSFTHSKPTELNNEKMEIIKQQKIIVIKKPETCKQYFYFSIFSSLSTQIKVKAWFQQTPFDRFYNLCYETQKQKQRSFSQQNTHTDDEATLRIKLQQVNTSMIQKQNDQQKQNEHKLRTQSPRPRISSLLLNEKIEQAQRKRMSLYSTKIISHYQKLIQYQYKQLHGMRMMKKYVQFWAFLLSFLQVMDQIYAHFKLNKILKCMTNQPKVYAQRWKHNKEKQPGMNTRVLTQVHLLIAVFSSHLYQKIETQITDLVYSTLSDLKFMKQQAQLQQAFVNYYVKVKKIQQFFIKQRNKFYCQMEFMIIYCRSDFSALLISKQRKVRIISEFYRILCQKHKIEFKRFLSSLIDEGTMITSYFLPIQKPKLNILKNQKLLLEIIDQIK